MPADGAQLLFLGGIVCLIISQHSRWWPAQTVYDSPAQLFKKGELNEQIRVQFVLFLSFARYPLIFSSMAGYFVCFWPGERPIRRILGSVCFPAILSLAAICGRFLYISAQPISVLESSGSLIRILGSWPARLWALGPGFQYCLLGIALILVYVRLIAVGSTSLPLVLPPPRASEFQDAVSWKRTKFLVWMLIGPLFLAGPMLAFLTMGLLYLSSSHLPAYLGSEWFVRLGRIVDPLIALGITCWVAGRDGRQAAWHSIRAFQTQYALLGAAVPIGVSLIISVGNYVFDRVLWAHGFGVYWVPEFRTYFDFPDPWLLLLFFGAFFEEIVFRGLLQPRFIHRYGIYRGIFLVAIVWAAFHFFSDSYSGTSDIGVVLRLASRVFTCLVLGFVFSWLTLRSGSVLPAAIAHTLFNVFVFSNFGPDFNGKDPVRLVLWAVVAYLLFRYWPVKAEDEPGAVATIVEPEPAT
jgi:membrane protease YdiL (CAAX protease family)